MSNTKSFKGCWWLPTKPDNQWYGTLKWRPGESPKLKVLYRTVDRAAAPPAHAESILGVDEGGTAISVLKLGFHRRTEPGFLSQQNYIAGHAIRGIHVISKDVFRARRFNVSVQYLGDWLREEGFSQSDSFEISYDRPPDRTFEIARGVTVELCHYARSFARGRQRKVSYDIVFSMEKSHSFSWKQAYRSIDALITFIHFACLKRVKSTGVSFEDVDDTLIGRQRKAREKIEVFNGGISPRLKDNFHENDFVFMFHDIEDRFANLCADWLQFCIGQREALACYDATVYFSLPDSLRLISITQALEAYHQRFYQPRGDVKFRDRIKDLCGIQRSRVEALVGNIEQFATVVTDSRDYYTHHHPSIRKRGTVAAGTKLTMLSYHLQFLFRICVLSQFGLERDRFGVLLRQIPGIVIEY